MTTNQTCAGGFMFPQEMREEMCVPTIGSAVHHPAHYTKGGIETIDFIRAKLGAEGFRAYCLGNVLKYVTRWQDKNGEEDLKKALVYLEWAIEDTT
jgi:hypothetical protein